MDLAKTNVHAMASRRMDYLSERQSLIAENLANADTPGYRAKDLVPFSDVLKQAAPVRPARTSEGHLPGTLTSGNYARASQDGTWAGSPSGNNVVIEEQMLKAAEIKGGHDMATSLYKKSAAMMSSVLRRE